MALQVSELPPVSTGTIVERQRRAIAWDFWVPGLLLAVIAGACFLGPFIAPIPPPNAADLGATLAPPGSAGHLLGTDALGRDLLSRLLHGGQVSIEIGLASTALGMAVGGLLGMVAGFIGGVLDVVVMRVLDVLLAFPSLVLALVVAAYLGPSESHVIYAISFFTVPAFGRLARAGTLRVRDRGYVLASRLCGTSRWRSLGRHIIPNVVPDVMSYGLLIVGIAMIVEASLSYLGLGVRPPMATWGSIIADGESYLNQAPYLSLLPGAFLFATVVPLNLLGDAIRARIEFGKR